MQLEIYKDYNLLSMHTADEIVAAVKHKPDAVLCLAAGDTPRMTYGILSDLAREGKIDFSRCTFIGLDEWIGIPPENAGSCHYFLERHLFTPLQIARSQIHLFDSLAEDTEEACRKMDLAISKKGGIDLMVVGVGMNGHIGFNEPGVSPGLYSHVIALDNTTQTVGQKYFNESTKLRQGITLGLQHVMESRKAILIASGIKKAEIIRKSLEGPITTEVPASLIRKHLRSQVILDEDAASLLQSSRSL